MKKIILIIFIFSFSFTKAQDYSSLIKKGNTHLSKKKYEDASKYYKEAFSIQSGTYNDYYNAACAFSLNNEPEESFKYLKLAAQNGFKNLKHIKNDRDLDTLKKLPKWENILKIVEKNQANYEKYFDQDLKKTLEDLFIKDQTLRQLYLDAEKKFGKDSDEMKFFWNLMEIQDEKNQAELINLLNKYGWSGTSKVGGKANIAQFLIIQHAPMEIQEQYLPLLEESVLNNESKGSHLAMLEDRILVSKNKPQKYGTQFYYDKKLKANILYQIENKNEVDKRRNRIGLDLLETYLKKFNIRYDQ
ncbi:DUF6624 domain-containing protein [Aureivirga sp. CE67]|uniref:DUF6624 domain-containing protein n=1 Tax=Aureivirga sp. CE67 TaxID=1788983 RepID=UPI0018C94E8E|nr:DUF6624 domain-containing protein [Aureivirga sp. CE67]